jgi:hypothetical protein
MIIEHLPRSGPVARTPYTIWRIVPGQRHNSLTRSPELRFNPNTVYLRAEAVLPWLRASRGMGEAA